MLNTIAAFRMPSGYETLVALLVKEQGSCADEGELDAALIELEDCGLLGWDRRSNRFDLHPIVRAVAWSAMEAETRQGVYANLHGYFSTLPTNVSWHEVKSIDDLTTAIELYNTLISLERYHDAMTIFHERLRRAMLYRLNASQELVELMEMLFPDGLDRLPRLQGKNLQGYAYNTLALGYIFSGQPLRAVPLLKRATNIAAEIRRDDLRKTALNNLGEALRHVGKLRETEGLARLAWVISCEQDSPLGKGLSLEIVGLILALRGMLNESEFALTQALEISLKKSLEQLESRANYLLAQRALWLGDFMTAERLADRLQQLARTLKPRIESIRAARIRGEVKLGLKDLVAADEQLHYAVVNARQVNLAQEELPALVALAELRRKQGDLQAAREFLEDVWDPAERGPYTTIHADAAQHSGAN